MIRYHKKGLIDSTTTILSIWIMIIGLILAFGLVNVNAEQKCCFSTSSELVPTSNLYRLNLTASHVDSKKGGNLYVVAISFQPGYSVIGQPYSPFSKVTCSLDSSSGIPQYTCQSKDTKTFFISFDLSIQPPPSLTNSTVTANSVFIFGDKCQDVAFCTDLAEKNEIEDTDKISLGPLGTWPKYAVIIGGVILGLALLVAFYFVYKRNRPDERFRDRSTTPGSNNNYEDKIFSPNSLLRNGDDDDLPPPSDERPKNTLIQFGSITAHSPERSKSVKTRDQQSTSLTKSSTTTKKREKKEKNYHEIDIHDDNIKSDRGDKVPSSVIIEINNNNKKNNNDDDDDDDDLDRSKSYKTRKNNSSKDNNNVNRLSGYSTSDMSKTISNNDISDRELSDNNNNNNNNDEFYSSNITTKKHLSSNSLHRSKSKLRNSGEESRSGRRSSNNNNNNNNNNNKPRRRSTSKGVEEDRDGRKVDRTTSRRHRSHSRSRKSTSPPPPASKSTGDLQKSLSTRTRQIDRDLTSKNKKSFANDRNAGKNNNVSSRSSANLDRKKSHRQRDLISHADTESTTSSDVPLGDRLPLAMLVTKLPPSWKNDDDDDDDTTPLGRIGSFGATSTSSHTRLISNDRLSNNKQSLDFDADNYYDSILNEMLSEDQNQNHEVDKISDDDYPIGKSLSKIKEKESGTVSDEEVPIGRLRSA